MPHFSELFTTFNRIKQNHADNLQNTGFYDIIWWIIGRNVLYIALCTLSASRMPMRQIESFFHQVAPSVLFHYTSIGSVMRMAKSRSIWASNVYYLNDSREVIHACEILDDELSPQLVFGDQSSTETKFCSQLSKWANQFRTTHHSIFIFSLSQQSSLLSQWRSYTPHGKGVSIGFSPAILNQIAQSSQAVLVKCIYKREEQQVLIRSLVEKILTSFRQWSPQVDLSREHPDYCYFKFLEQFRGDFLRVLCVIKHPAFEEEQEWRLISPYYPPQPTPPLIKFREGASMLVPYVEFPLPSAGQVFEAAILGPSQHQDLSMSAVRMYLSNQDLCSYMENCTIPYREWWERSIHGGWSRIAR